VIAVTAPGGLLGVRPVNHPICWEKTEMNGNDPVAIEPDRAYIE
jgi:hypothetical protein